MPCLDAQTRKINDHLHSVQLLFLAAPTDQKHAALTFLSAQLLQKVLQLLECLILTAVVVPFDGVVHADISVRNGPG